MPESDRTTVPVAQGSARQRLKRIDRLGYLLDQSIRIPGIGYRIGYDAVIGLVPGLGDVIGMVLSIYIVWEASRFGLPKATLVRMVMNVGIEALFGAVPVLGDVFDATFKANLRNLALLHDRLGDAGYRAGTADRRFLIVLFGVLVVVVFALCALVVLLIVGLLHLAR